MATNVAWKRYRDPDHDFYVPDNDFFGLGPAEYAGEVYQQGLVKSANIQGLFPRPALAPGQPPPVGLRGPSERSTTIRREPCTFVRADTRADGTKWPANVGRVQPWLICFVCGQQFSPASLCIHEPQCLAKYKARARKIDPTPRRPRVRVEPPMSAVEYNELAYKAYNDSANSRCPLCGKTFANDKIEMHIASCTDVMEDDEVSEMMAQAVGDGKTEEEAVREAMRLWRQTHPKPGTAAVALRGSGPAGGAAGINELLFREWLDELRGYSQCFHELRPGERQADAQERHLEYVEYTSTVGEHLDGKAIQAALDERHGVRSGGVRQQKLHKRLRQIAQLRAMEEAGRELRPEQLALVAREPALRSELQTLTAPRPATKDWDLREAGARVARPLHGPGFSGVLRNEWRFMEADLEKRGGGITGRNTSFKMRRFMLGKNRLSYIAGRKRRGETQRINLQRGTVKVRDENGENGMIDTDIQLVDATGRMWQLRAPTAAVAQGWAEAMRDRTGVVDITGSDPVPSVVSSSTLSVLGQSVTSAAGSAPDEPVSDAAQPVRISEARLETKFPLRPEERRRPAADPLSKRRRMPGDFIEGPYSPATWEAARQARQADLEPKPVALGECLVTQPLSRLRHLEAAFDTVDTRPRGGRMEWRGLQKLMSSAGLPVSDDAAKAMVAEASVGGAGDSLTIEEFVRMLKIS